MNTAMRVFIQSVSMIFLLLHNCYAWNDDKSHPAITLRAIQSADETNIDSIIIERFGIQEGSGAVVNGVILSRYIHIGSELEDASDKSTGPRGFNHFHDPTKPLMKAGFLLPPLKGNSAMNWAFFNESNLWDLQSFYLYFERALTAETEEERLSELAKMFRAAGQVMHLVEDMAVPAHTRNELLIGHTQQLKLEKIPVGSPLEYFLEKNPRYIQSVSREDIPSFDYFTDYFDTQTDRTNGEAVAGLSFGLAEYSNANYLSELQYFINGVQLWPHPYPSPSLGETYSWSESYDTYLMFPHLAQVLPASLNAIYLGRMSSNHERNIRHLARLGFLSKYSDIEATIVFLDKECHKEYLTKLVPKAVAYAAGLLEFLFRGNVDFDLDRNSESLSITNSTNDSMSGFFELLYDGSDGIRNFTERSWDLTIPAGETVTVDAALGRMRDLGDEEKFTLVFKGTLGEAEGVVTGRTKRMPLRRADYISRIEYDDLQFYGPVDYFGPANDGTDRRNKYYFCELGTENTLSPSTIARHLLHTFRVEVSPALSERLGFGNVPGTMIAADTDEFYNPGIVDYFKVSTAPGKWTYLYDSTGTHRVEGWGPVRYPAKFTEGLWRPESGYVDFFRQVPGAENSQSECTLQEWPEGAKVVRVQLYYHWDQYLGWQPDCPGAPFMLQRAGEICQDYSDLRAATIAMNGPYMPVLKSGDWRNYGFEIRLNWLQIPYSDSAKGIFYDAPFTFVKAYGSDEVLGF